MFGQVNIFRVRKINKMNYWVINEWREYQVDQGEYGIFTYQYKAGYQLFSSKKEALDAATTANLRESIEVLDDENYDPSAFKHTFKGSFELYIKKVCMAR